MEEERSMSRMTESGSSEGPAILAPDGRTKKQQKQEQSQSVDTSEAYVAGKAGEAGDVEHWVDDLTDDDLAIERGMFYSDIDTQGSSSDGMEGVAAGLAGMAAGKAQRGSQARSRRAEGLERDGVQKQKEQSHHGLSALQRVHSRRMYRSLSCRPDAVEDFCIGRGADPNKCVEAKFGSMRRTWTFLDLRLEIDALEPQGTPRPDSPNANRLRRSKTVQ